MCVSIHVPTTIFDSLVQQGVHFCKEIVLFADFLIE